MNRSSRRCESGMSTFDLMLVGNLVAVLLFGPGLAVMLLFGALDMSGGGRRVRVESASRTAYATRMFFGHAWRAEKQVDAPLAFFAWKRGEDTGELFLAVEEEGETRFLRLGAFPAFRGDWLASLNRAVAPPPSSATPAK